MKCVAVIGAGPCGLPALKEIRDAGHDVVLFERSGTIGGVFAGAAAYPDLHLTISNWAMAFSDFPDSRRLSYSSAEEYLQYLKDYTRHFDLERYIQYHSEVLSARMLDSGRWELEVLQGPVASRTSSTIQVDGLVVATGAHHVRNDPPAELAGFDGQIIHSSQYDEAFKRKVAEKKLRVMVVGGGESSADISSELGELSPNNVSVWLKRPHCFGPRYLNKAKEMDQVRANKTKDFAANSFLEAAMTNRMSAAQNVYLYGLWRRILWRLPILNNSLNRMCIESTTSAFFLNDQATFVTKNQRLCEAVEDKKIEVLVSPTLSVDKRDCEFRLSNGTAAKRSFDAVVLCTGYRLDFPWLKLEGFRANPRAWFLHCFPPGVGQTLSFIGYARPHQGGIPPMAEIQARYVAQILRGDRSLPSNYPTLARYDEIAERNYYYISPNLDTLVDYAAFLESVARRVGCEPQLPTTCTILFNLHMTSVLAMALRYLGPSSLKEVVAWWHPLALWVATTAGFFLVDDGLLIKWWLYPQWPVWYRQRGPGAKPTALRGILNRVPLWQSTKITTGFALLVFWSIPTFYIQRILSVFLYLPHVAITSLGFRFPEALGGLLRPKMVVLHSHTWRFSDLFLP